MILEINLRVNLELKMKRLKVNIKLSAVNDIESRFLQIHEESPLNAENWYLDIIQCIESLDLLAMRCPLAPEDEFLNLGIRHLIVGRYRVLFIINDSTDSVDILHVRHTRHERKL